MNASEGGPAVEIPQYRCHKVVRAAKITEADFETPGGMTLLLGEIGGRVFVSDEWLGKHVPASGVIPGYYVVYEDGYASFSPAKAFEEGYAPLPRTHQQRAIAERAELRGRLAKLLDFLGGAVFVGLDSAEKSRLRRQADAMNAYANALDERIATF